MDIYAHAFSRKAKSKIENIGGKAILLMPANNKGHQAAE
jgi:ribosomal protein L18E